MDSPPVTELQGLSLPQRVFWSAGFFLLCVLLPAVLIEILAADFQKERKQFLESTYQEHAKALIGRLDLSLDRNALMEEGFQRFRRRAERLLRGDPLGEETARALTILSRGRFPRNTLFFWFDRQRNLLQPRGLPTPTKRRSWQALFRAVLSPDGLAPDDEILAPNLIKSSMGEVLNADFLRESLHKPYKILLDGQAFTMRILSFRGRDSARSPLGHLMVFVPTGRARFGWELERLVKRFSGPEAEVGGYWQSREDGIGAEFLSPSFMHFVLGQLAHGQGFYVHGDLLILARYWSQDPDLMLVVAVRNVSRAALEVERTVSLVRWAVRGSVLVIALILGSFASGRLPLRLSLRTKVRLAAVSLAGFSCLGMVVLGFGHRLRLSEFRDNEAEKRLEGLLTSVEQFVSSGISATQKQLLRLGNSPELLRVKNKAELETVFQPFEELGLYEVLFNPRGKEPLSFIRREARRSGLVNGPQFRAVIKKFLGQAGLEVDSKLGTPGKEVEELFTQEFTADQLFLDKLQLIHFAGDAGFVFFTLATDHAGQKIASLMVSLGFNGFCKRYFQQWLAKEKPSGCGIFLQSSAAKGIRHAPRNDLLRGILRQAEETKEPVFQTITIRNRTYKVLGRPLAGLGTVGLAVIPFDDRAGVFPATRRFMATFAVLALLSALFFSDLFLFLFLRPIQGLGAVIRKVEEGEAQVRSPLWPTDELGSLAQSFNRMVEGLEQKERMLPFLSRDLLERSQTSQEVRIERRHVAVSFAGLRGFSSLESQLSPEDALSLMSEFLGRCEVRVRQWGGEIDKFLGDSAMAVFWEGSTSPTVGVGAAGPPEERAVRAALDLQKDLADWALERWRGGLPPIRFGVGITAGTVIGGHIGSLRKRLDFTVIGDTVNLAARLEKLAGREGNPQILAGAEVFRQSWPGVRMSPTQIQQVRGRTGTITVFGVEADGS